MIDYRNIIIEGNIGAGKTTLTNALGDKLDARVILESFADNPFLEHFYKDPERYAFQVELFFLAERYKQQSGNLLGDIFHQHTVSDYLFAKSAIFSGVNLGASERDLFQTLYQIMVRFMPPPEILIYLHIPVDKTLEQIKQRGRPYEQSIKREYLETIESAYFNFFKEVRHFPVVIMEESDLENRNLDTTLNLTIEILEKKWPNGLSYFNTHKESA